MVRKTVYECPVNGCDEWFESPKQLQGHMATVMRFRDDHKWENVPIGHHNLEPARTTREVTTLADFE